MESVVAPVRNTLDLNTRLMLNALDGVDDELALKRPNDTTNHIAFLVLHALDARYYLARELGEDIENPFKDLLEGKKGVEDIEDYPSLDAVREALRDVSDKLAARLETITPEDLESKAGYSFPIEGGETVLGALNFLVHHDTYHLGQISLLRRYFGLEPMSYR